MLSYIPCFFKTNSSNLKMKMKIIITFSLGFFFWRGGEGGLGRKGGSGFSIFLDDVIHPIKLQGLVLQGNTTF
jgi:hypothetical protein